MAGPLRGWKGQPGQFSVVIEREAGLVRYWRPELAKPPPTEVI